MEWPVSLGSFSGHRPVAVLAMTTGADQAWLLLSLASAACTTARHLIVKYRCRHLPAETLVFSTRVLGAAILAPVALTQGMHIQQGAVFIPVTALTVVATAAATILQIDVIQKEALSRSVPFLSFIPVFMIPWTILLYGEYPAPFAFAGILAACAGAYWLHCRPGSNALEPIRAVLADRGSRIMMIAALGLGLTTACDKAAIGASSAMTYAFLWTAASAVLMGVFVFRHGARRVGQALASAGTALQALFWAGAFGFQMAAIQRALHISSGVTYVKTLTMIHILFTVGLGGALSKERRLPQSLAAAALMFAGAVLVVFAG